MIRKAVFCHIYTFEEQLQYLKDNEWEVIDVKQFLLGIEQPETLPTKSTLIIFDDGYKSNLEVAVPILQKFSYPTIVFVPTSFIGEYNAFDADIFYEPKEQIFTWDELVQLEKNEVSVQCHGVFHSRFSQLTEDEQMLEIVASKKLLESSLQKKVTIFSFPYGDNGGNTERMNQLLGAAGYKCAVLYGGGITNLTATSPFELPRIAVGPDTKLEVELCRT